MISIHVGAPLFQLNDSGTISVGKLDHFLMFTINYKAESLFKHLICIFLPKKKRLLIDL